MAVSLTLALLSAAFLLLAVYLKKSRRAEWKLRAVEADLMKWGNKPPGEEARRKLLKTLFALAAQGVTEKDGETVSYRAVDLLQLAYGQGIARPDEPVHITALVSSLLNQNRPGLAAAVLDCYRGLLRKIDNAAAAAEQLQTAGVLAMKAKHGFVAAKATDILLTIFERPENLANREAVAAALNMLKICGKYALKRDDLDYYRELVARLKAFVTGNPAYEARDMVSLLSLWLHVIVSKQNEAALTLLTDFVQELTDRKVFSRKVVEGILAEWQDLAGIASLNPASPIAAIIIHDMVALAAKIADNECWTNTVNACARIVRMIIEQYGTQYAFPLLYPLLDEGRKLLSDEIRFDVKSTTSDYRQRALFTVVKEFISVAEFAARVRITGSTYDIINEFYFFWHQDPALNYKIKSAKKFFQLVLLFWQKTMARQAKKQMPERPELLEPVLLSTIDISRLSFMAR